MSVTDSRAFNIIISVITLVFIIVFIMSIIRFSDISDGSKAYNIFMIIVLSILLIISIIIMIYFIYRSFTGRIPRKVNENRLLGKDSPLSVDDLKKKKKVEYKPNFIKSALKPLVEKLNNETRAISESGELTTVKRLEGGLYTDTSGIFYRCKFGDCEANPGEDYVNSRLSRPGVMDKYAESRGKRMLRGRDIDDIIGRPIGRH
jgi:hypothetical protein